MDIEIIKKAVLDILKNLPHRPFLCLPMSATLYAILKDNYGIYSKLVTGDLYFKDQIIFKQDFSISKAKPNILQYWSGHSWVEIENLICDLSIFRTLYSDKFTKPCKAELIKEFGVGRGCLIATKEAMKQSGLQYNGIDCLEDYMATAIIEGFRSTL